MILKQIVIVISLTSTIITYLYGDHGLTVLSEYSRVIMG